MRERDRGKEERIDLKCWTEMNDDLPAQHTNTQVRIMDVNVISFPLSPLLIITCVIHDFTEIEQKK